LSKEIFGDSAVLIRSCHLPFSTSLRAILVLPLVT
jgi:hypothetical protein